MRGLFVGTVGALVLVTAAFGLSLGAFREGPHDRPLEPVTVTATAEGTYHSRAATVGPLGTCVQPPCDARTTLDLTVRGMPDVPYVVRLQGTSGREDVGTFRPADGTLTVRWDQARDHGDKDRLVFSVADRDVASLAVRATAAPLDLAGPLPASWGARPDVVHVNEIGGVVISSVAAARLVDVPPEGWGFRAQFEGASGTFDLGLLESEEDGVFLDGRAERLRLEDHERVVILVVPEGASEGEGFPVLEADLWP